MMFLAGAAGAAAGTRPSLDDCGERRSSGLSCTMLLLSR